MYESDQIVLQAEQNGKISIGSNCFFNNYCSINSLSGVVIGKDCIFSENVKIYDHNHRFSDIRRPIALQGYSLGPVQIGDSCWIGSNVTILKGVTIGENSVIGANCLICKSIPANSIVRSVGNVCVEQRI